MSKRAHVSDIIDLVIKYANAEKPLNLIISGMSCSGKTTLSRNIESVTPFSVTIHQDDYFKNLEDFPKYNGYTSCDGLDAYRTVDFTLDSMKMMGYQAFKGPLYELSENRIVSYNAVDKMPQLIRVYEGLHTKILIDNGKFMSSLINQCKTVPVVGEKISIHMSPGYDECLRRRIERDYKQFRVPEEKTRRYFENVIWPVYKLFDEVQAKSCDYLVEG